MHAAVTLTQYLIEQQRHYGKVSPELRLLIEVIARACKAISHVVSKGPLAGIGDAVGLDNVQGEAQKKLDVIANEVLVEANEWGGQLAAWCPRKWPSLTRFRIAIRKGSSCSFTTRSTDLRTSTSIFQWERYSRCCAVRTAAAPLIRRRFSSPVRNRSRRGFAVYGAATILVLTVGNGVVGFTLDREVGQWVLTDERILIPEDTQEFAINASNARNWEPPIKRYIDECLAGTTGTRDKDFNMRWVASMVADVYRILSRGGIFMYPKDSKHKEGRLRLMYEANPWLSSSSRRAAPRPTAASASSTSSHRASSARGRDPGSKNEVERVTRYHTES
jgi:fructose-1,6-bisphosphatase I